MQRREGVDVESLFLNRERGKKNLHVMTCLIVLLEKSVNGNTRYCLSYSFVAVFLLWLYIYMQGLLKNVGKLEKNESQR